MFYNRAKELLTAKGIEVHMTYGYITKNTRIRHGLEKSHCIDALCISGHPDAEQIDHYYLKKKVRCNNRQIHKLKILKGGYRKSNQAEKVVKGFKLFDVVRYQNNEYILFGRRNSGYFDIRTLIGEKVNNGSISYKKLKYIRHSSSMLTERRPA